MGELMRILYDAAQRGFSISFNPWNHIDSTGGIYWTGISVTVTYKQLKYRQCVMESDMVDGNVYYVLRYMMHKLEEEANDADK